MSLNQCRVLCRILTSEIKQNILCYVQITKKKQTMNIFLIYNPHAGNGRARKLLPEVMAYLHQKDIKPVVLETKYPGHATKIVTETDITQYDAVIASGGDGTMFEVLNGYYQNSANHKPPLGLIPNGTGNAFSRELGLEKADWKKAIDIISQNNKRSIDVGKLNTEGKTYYIINIVGMGFVTDIAEASVPLKWMGNTAYTVATLYKLLFLKSKKMSITVDTKVLQRDCVFVEIANSTFTGTTFYIAPKAKVDDGLLDVIILNKIPRLKLLKVFTSIFDGTHIKYPEIEYIQAKKIKVEEEFSGRLIPDGEILGSTPMEMECLKQDIEFLWPTLKEH